MVYKYTIIVVNHYCRVNRERRFKKVIEYWKAIMIMSKPLNQVLVLSYRIANIDFHLFFRLEPSKMIQSAMILYSNQNWTQTKLMHKDFLWQLKTRFKMCFQY